MSSDSAPKRMLLHACCGPCSLEPTRMFAEEGIDFTLDYYNPNIYPPQEYEHRLSTLKEYVAEPRSIDLVEDAYDPDNWEHEVAIFGTDREKRCRACYRLRFEHVACEAERRGFDAISTTLTISPYQFTDIILEELDAAARRHDLQTVGRDFREHYAQATRISREKGMYRQNYCGCRFSIAEAKAEREAARAQREREKRIKHAAILVAAAEGIFSQQNQL